VNRKLHNQPELKSFRKALRSSLTPAEAGLWKVLQRSQLDGFKFRRQASIGRFIVDFYCPEAKLIIELDGEGHIPIASATQDVERDTELKGLGFQVLRFENKRIFEDLDNVLDEIRYLLSAKGR
jgi:very-short-patch-repair endonuclease